MSQGKSNYKLWGTSSANYVPIELQPIWREEKEEEYYEEEKLDAYSETDSQIEV